MSKDLVVREEAQPFNTSLPVTREMLGQLQEQRKLLKEFVSSQLHRDSDYGVIPGTKKNSLYKPGAEKIRSLFGLTVKLDNTAQILEKSENFAMFTYKAQVFKGDQLIAECEGSANSQEQKYKERKVWRYSEKERKKVEIRESTPIFDVLNTLQKMSQKRAFVGAIILAVGASDFFTQDIDDPEDARHVGTAPTIEDKNEIPNVISVSAQPVQNNQSRMMLVEAVVSYEEKDLAKNAGFRYNAATKKWTKQISSSEYQTHTFPFEILEVQS